MNAPTIHIGDHISNAGDNATLINKSTITSAFNQIRNDHGEAVANALGEVVRYIEQASNETASAHLALLLQELASKPANPSIVQTLWNGLVATIPAIASLPAAMAFVTNVIQR